MARLSRLSLPGRLHHILQRGNNRQAVVLDDEDRAALLQALRDEAAQAQVAVHAYVLMDNHLHLLATPATAEGVSQMMQGAAAPCSRGVTEAPCCSPSRTCCRRWRTWT